MFATIMNLTTMYEELVKNRGDPRTKDWYMIKSPVPTMSLIISYIVFVTYLGPKMMANRKPYQLKTAMIIYNSIQAFLSILLFTAAARYGWLTRYNWVCQPIDFNHPDEDVMVHIGFYFFLVRFLEFTDTVFFILRKKNNQVSVLHVLHHSMIPVVFWIGMLFVPSGHFTLAGFLNAGVHSFMYTYYLLTAMGISLSGCKKYMTIMQLVQFIAVMIHTVNSLLSDCAVSKPFGLVILTQALVFFGMFSNFYLKAFSSSSSKPSAFSIVANKYFGKQFNMKSLRTLFETCTPDQRHLHTSTESVQINGKTHDSLQNGLSNRKQHVH